MPPDLAPAPAAAPIVLPPADQPPAPAAPKSFADRWKAVESQVDDGPAIEATETPAPPQEAPKKNDKAPAADPKEAKRAQLKALADELGLVVDDSGVSVADRAEFRRAKSAREAAITAREAEVTKKLAELESTHGEKHKKVQAVLDAYERGDPESFAQALGAKDFNELQQSWIKRLADPNYMELRRLQKRAEEEDARRENEKKETETRAQHQERERVYVTYMKSLSDSCKASENPLVQAMAEDPLFLRDVYRIQGENWDNETQSTVTVEQAIKKAAKNGGGTLEESLRGVYERLGKGFGSVGATAPAAAAKTNGKKPAPKTAVVPASAGAGGGAPKKPSEMTPTEWAAYKRAKFEEAED